MDDEKAIWRVDPTNPTIAEAIEAWKAEWKGWHARMDAWREANQRRMVLVYPGGSGENPPIGISGPEVTDDPMPGWVAYKKNQRHGVAWLVPMKGPDGDEARRVLAALKPPPTLDERLAAFGLPVPGIVTWTHHWYTWGYTFRGDDVYFVINKKGVDALGEMPEWAQRVKLSEWYAMIEAEEAAAAR